MALQGSSGLSYTLLWPSSLIHGSWCSSTSRPRPRSVMVSLVIFLIEPPSACLPFFFCCASSHAHAVIHSAPGGVFRHAGPYGFRRVFCIARCGTCCFSHPATLSAAGSNTLVTALFFTFGSLSLLPSLTLISTVVSDTHAPIFKTSIWTCEFRVQLSGSI